MSSGISTLKANTRQTREYVIDCITAKKPIVPFIQSSPAMGKSSIVKSIADEYGMELIDHRLSTSAPEDLTGLPFFDNGIAKFAPFDTFPIKETKIPEGKNGWILFLDEFNSAPKSVQAAAYKLVLDKAVGQNPLHERVVIVAAGNLATDRAIVNPLSTAMQSRVAHIEMELVHAHFMEDVAYKYGWDDRIIAYLSFDKDALYDFRPDHNEKTFCSPRTWEFMNNLIQGKEYRTYDKNGQTFYEMDTKAPLYAGVITSGHATKFITFTKVFQNLPDIKSIINDPFGTILPDDKQLRFAIATHLMSHVDEESFEAITKYIGRFTSEFRVMFYRGLMVRKPEYRSHPAFATGALDILKFLHGD